MTKLEQITKISKSNCNCLCADCILTNICGREPREVALSLLDLLSYDSDLSKCKVGDWVWIAGVEWTQIIGIDPCVYYPICLLNKGLYKSYTFDGKYNLDDYAPSAFIRPPLCFNPRPKPEPVCHFKRGDRKGLSLFCRVQTE